MLRLISATALAVLTAATLHAQFVTDFNPPRANCCLPGTAQSLADQLQDWNQLGRYHADDATLMAQPADPHRVVFMGDSITDFWRLQESFPGKPYVNRGISGQTTPQMLVRMYPDVIDLHPAVVVILAGTNDIAHNTGPETLQMVEENLMAMTELAQAHNIKVVLCSLTPITDTPMPQPGRGGNPNAAPRRKQSEQRPPADILALNNWMKSYAARVNATFVDYFSAVVDTNGMFKSDLTFDGLHPNPEGYAAMAPVVAAALDRVVR